MVPPKDWGVAALTEFADPRMTVLVKGVGALLLPTTSSKPEGVDAKFKVDRLRIQEDTLGIL